MMVGRPGASQRIMEARYEVPSALGLSSECCDLLARMLVPTPAHRVTVPSIKRHPFFLRNLPRELQANLAPPTLFCAAATAALPHYYVMSASNR